jgi:uncharacterized membrane protein YagU involved in acid resistance
MAGTAAMTAWQESLRRLKDDPAEGAADTWAKAPPPAKLGKRLIEGLFHREVGAEHLGLLTNVVHWTYGTAWGAAYGIVQGTLRAHPLVHGLVFGSGVWAMAYVQLVPMGIYEPPWKYPVRTLAEDLSHHLVYGLGVAGAYHVVAGANRVSSPPS